MLTQVQIQDIILAVEMLSVFFILTAITKLLFKGTKSNEHPTTVRRFSLLCNLAKVKHNQIF